MTMCTDVKYLDVEKYTYSNKIYTIREETHEDGVYFFINGDTGYKATDWTIEDAINDYLSPNGYEFRVNAFYKAWGFYD